MLDMDQKYIWALFWNCASVIMKTEYEMLFVTTTCMLFGL